MDSQDSWWTIPVASLVIVISAVLVLSCRQTDGHTDAQTDADERFTHATVVVVVSNYEPMCVFVHAIVLCSDHDPRCNHQWSKPLCRFQFVMDECPRMCGFCCK